MMHTGATQQGSTQAGDKNAVRPFHVNVPEAELTELRRRINATSGLNEKRLQINRKAYSSRRFRRWRAIGRQIMTGARSRQK